MPLLSPYIRRVRMAKAAPFVAGDVLDLGCGEALVHQTCSAKIRRYVGIEKSENAIAQLKQRFPALEFYQRDLDKDELNIPGYFDVVVMLAVIEHVFNQKHLFTRIVHCLKPGGRIVVTTPTVFGNDVVLRVGAKLGLFWNTATDEHIVIYNKSRLQIIAREVGLTLRHFERFEFGCNQLAVFEI